MPSRFRFGLLAKAGYAARGVVFLLVAGLALFSGVTGGRPEMKCKRGVMTARKHSVWNRIVSTVDLSGHYDWVDQFQGRSSSILFAG
jgi:hypothetical protein